MSGLIDGRGSFTLDKSKWITEPAVQEKKQLHQWEEMKNSEGYYNEMKCSVCGVIANVDNFKTIKKECLEVLQKEKIDTSIALKYDTSLEKLPWDLLPVEPIEGMLRVLAYGARKYTICGDCGAKTYPNPRLDGDAPREDCPDCGSKNIIEGKNNWRKGFKYTRLIAAAFRHLKAILQGEDIDGGPLGSGLPHVDHLLCMVAFLSGHMKCGYGIDDRWKGNTQ